MSNMSNISNTTYETYETNKIYEICEMQNAAGGEAEGGAREEEEGRKQHNGMRYEVW